MKLGLLCALLPAALWAQAGLVLFDFEQGPDLTTVEQRSVAASYEAVGEGRTLRIASTPEDDWPGLTLLPSAGAWDASSFTTIEMDVTNLGANALSVALRADNPGADGVKNCVTGHLDLKAGESGTLRQELTRKSVAASPIEFIGMRAGPFGKDAGNRTVDAKNLTALLDLRAQAQGGAPVPGGQHPADRGVYGSSRRDRRVDQGDVPPLHRHLRPVHPPGLARQDPLARGTAGPARRGGRRTGRRPGPSGLGHVRRLGGWPAA